MNKPVNGHGTGWLHDYPDIRDYTLENVVAKGALKAAPVSMVRSLAPIVVGNEMRYNYRLANTLEPTFPTSMDLRQWCSPIEDQGALGSCTAFAGIGLVEYAMRRTYGRHVNVSPLFLYKATRNLMGVTGDTGAYLRETLKALAMLGVPPEENWPYRIAQFDVEPSGFLYALGQNYQAIKYIRLDPPGTPGDALLLKIKTMLVAGHPVCFGFTVYDSIQTADSTGLIPFPGDGERAVGGHAMVTVGYHDTMIGARGTKGGFMVRNSWGVGWGQQGYGWLPYDYVLQGLADDFWVIQKQEWLDTGAFGG